LTDISNYNNSSGSVGDVSGEKDATDGSLPVDDDMMQCQQPTQDDLGHLSMPDLSQTVDSSNSIINDSSAVMAMESDAGCEECDDTTNNFAHHHKNTSVQEILDRANSSADSVASTKKHDDDEEEEEVATFMEDDDDKEDQVAAAKNSANGQGNYPITTSDLHHLVNNTMTEATNSKGHGPPCARWGATMCKIHDDQILVYGGQSYDLEGNACIMEDVHIYNPKLATWEKPINSRGEKRQWHSSVYIPSRKQIIAFGGETIDPVSAAAKNKEKVVISDTLRVLDTDIMLWYPPAATGDVPTGRSGHSSVFFPETNEMVLFGGVRGSKWLNAVSILDISSWVWTTPKVEGMPPKPRSFHSATAVGNKMVIFGGNNKTSCFNTVHVLESIGRASGDESPGKGKVCEWKWSHPSVKGKAPFPRTGHSATLLEDGKTICIYGGWDPNEEDEMSGEENIFNSSYLLDTEDWTWRDGPKAQPMGSGTASHVVQDCGSKRCGHQAVLNSDNGEILVFGGRIPGEALAGDMQKLLPSL
jgi:Galactose oxidase, central domain